MTNVFDFPDGATPLEPDELEGLIPTHVVNRSQLNALEQQNIAQAEFWLATARFRKINTDASLRKLHKQMFSQVWGWAGTFRKSGKNIGVDAYQISTELRKLCDDVDAWLHYQTYTDEEIAARFHHRLVLIHAFPNGNGRHARLATDILLTRQLKRPRFGWGQGIIDSPGKVRSQYINALRTADKGDYGALLAFVAR